MSPRCMHVSLGNKFVSLNPHHLLSMRKIPYLCVPYPLMCFTECASLSGHLYISLIPKGADSLPQSACLTFLIEVLTLPPLSEKLLSSRGPDVLLEKLLCL